MRTLLERSNAIIRAELYALASVQPRVVGRVITNLDSITDIRHLQYQDVDAILNLPKVKEYAVSQGFISDSRYRKSFIKQLFNEQQTKI